jgi:hypothetical protein
MEPGSSLPYSQVPANCPYPEPAPSSPHSPLPLPEDPSSFLCAMLNKHGNVTRTALCLRVAGIDLFLELLDVKWGSCRNAAHGQESGHSADRLSLALRGTPGDMHSSLKTEAEQATETLCLLACLLAYLLTYLLT